MLIDFIKYESSSIAVLRDDLYPALGGGNKGRKMQAIAKDIKEGGYDAIVSTGGIQSNHCRAVAISAAENGWKCKLILHGTRERFNRESGNAKLIRLAGPDIEFVEPSEIASAMDKAMEDFEALGCKPYYIYGGGHTLKGGEAYVQAVDDLSVFCNNSGWYPDFIFVASGTGSTQAGILAGLDKNSLRCKVIGISVARAKDRAETIVDEFYLLLKDKLQIQTGNREVIIKDNFLAGGYESSGKEIEVTIRQLAQNTGLFTDPTYTGKAFWGMMETLKKEQLSGNVLFWHTGGLNNLLSSDIL